ARVAVALSEQGRSAAGGGPLAAGEDAPRAGPALQRVPAGSFAQQRGQLGDVRFLDPAPAVPAAGVRASLIRAAFADLAAVIDGDLPGILPDQPDRGLLPLIKLPPGRVTERAPAPAGDRVQRLQ